MTTMERTLTDEQLAQYHRDGYLVVRGLFSPAETQVLTDHFMALHDAGVRGELEHYTAPPLENSGGDILRHFPRMMHPHRWDETSMDTMLDRRFAGALRDLFDEEPLAAQSMLYFKPPGARGQALHQDNFYLKVMPGTCMAAWLSLDAADRANGGMFVVPGSHLTGIQCPHAADLAQSFTIEEVDVPAGLHAVPVDLQAGDVMFFNGSVIHGSFPNTSRERFRRAFICHYVPASTSELSEWYHLLDFEGQAVQRAQSQWGGPCGTDELEALRRSALAQGDKVKVATEQNAVASIAA